VGETASRIIDYPEFLETSCRLGHTPLQAPAVLVRSTAHRAVGGYLAELPHSGDTEIWLRLASRGRVAAIDEVQAFRRQHASNMSLGFPPLERLREQLEAFEVHFLDRSHGPADARRYRAIVRATIAEAAFWTGAHAFERRQAGRCGEALTFARTCDPKIITNPSWSRLHWKRRLGPRTSAAVDRVYQRLRRSRAS
jgi:hypothetical protein